MRPYPDQTRRRDSPKARQQVRMFGGRPDPLLYPADAVVCNNLQGSLSHLALSTQRTQHPAPGTWHEHFALCTLHVAHSTRPFPVNR